MENSETKQKAINLGKQLVSELGRGTELDTLSRWMAHYIAELMTSADEATGADKQRYQEKCFDAVLTLWKHRAYFPDGRRPFEEYESVLQALASLSPEEPPRYYRHFAKGFNATNEQTAEKTKSAIDLILGLDHAARVIISELVAQALDENADENGKTMLENASAVSPGIDIDMLNQLIQNSKDANQNIDPEDVRREILINRIQKLRAFRELSLLYEKKLKRQIGENDCVS